jgi:hypothetical protein
MRRPPNPSLNAMTQASELVALRDEALRKIGRNVVNFQKVESSLKYLIAVSDVESTKDGLSTRHKKRTATIQKLPLGHLSEAFYESVYGADSTMFAPTDSSQITVSTSFRVEADAATVKKQKRALSALVAERNKLIHRDLSGFDHNSILSCCNLIAMLDEQNMRVLSQLEQLATLIAEFKAYMATAKVWADGDGPNLPAQRVSDDA